MQERAMKGVEVLRRQAGGATGLTPDLGIWISLETLMAIPLGEAARVELWRHLLEALESGDVDPSHGDGTAALRAGLCELEPVVACTCLEQGAWEQAEALWRSALEHHRQLERERPVTAKAIAPVLASGLIQVVARLDQVLTHGQWTPPKKPQEGARLHGLACDLLEQITGLGQPLPNWFAVVEEGLVRRGAMALVEQPDWESRRHAVALLLRLAELSQPVPEWLPLLLETTLVGLLNDLSARSGGRPSQAEVASLVASCRGLAHLAEDPQRRAAVAEALERAQLGVELPMPTARPAADAEQIGVLVEEWLEDTPASRSPVDLGLVWVPGARAIPHSPGRLELNLAALTASTRATPGALERGVEAFFRPLQEAATSRSFRLRQPFASLVESLAHYWGSGGQLSTADCAVLGWVQGVWNRLGGPGSLNCQRLPPPWPAAFLQPGCRVVQPTAMQWACLRSWLQDQHGVEQALAAIRRHHHDTPFLNQRHPNPWDDPTDALENLCQLQRWEGFYANAANPVASVAAWAEPSLDLLANSQVVIDPQLSGGAPFVVLEHLVMEQGKLPNLVSWPDEAAFYHLLAGQEVLLISPFAADVERQHHSGQAFELFTDLAIVPYGLRCLAGPDSRHPKRPDQGFEDSLKRCLRAIDEQAQAQPFSVFLTASGAYDLPLCHAVQQQYGCATVAIGPNLHARFGLEQPATQGWRSHQRRSDRWQCVAA